MKYYFQQFVYLIKTPYTIFSVVNNGISKLEKDVIRKSYFSIFIDLIEWLIKYKEVNRNYFQWGFYSKTRKEMNKYVPYQKGQNVVSKINREYKNYPYNYVALVGDKMIFSLLSQPFGIPTAPKIGLVKNKELYKFDKSNFKSDWSLLFSDNYDIICKPIDGQEGDEVYLLKTDSLNKKMYLDEKEISFDNFIGILNDKFWLLEKKIHQHSILASLNNSSLNTLRLTTVKLNDDVFVISAIQRMGVGNVFKDNWASGGIAVKVNQSNGCLGSSGYFRNGRIVETHPITKVKFNEVSLPFFKESIDLVKYAHGCMYGLYTIGWDIAITENGPLVIEANSNWSLDFVQQVDGGLREVFESLFYKINPKLIFS